MIFHCSKCSTPLTHPVIEIEVEYINNKLTEDSVALMYTDEHNVSYSQQTHRVKKGIYVSVGDMFLVSDSSVLEGIIPEFKSGHGCCNYNMGESLYCSCGSEIGEMYLDCFEDGIVEFIKGNVI